MWEKHSPGLQLMRSSVGCIMTSFSSVVKYKYKSINISNVKII